MTMSVDAYLAQLQALLPEGAALPRDPNASLALLLAALAEEFARIDGRADDLINEADPQTTSELLTDWERVYGLPDLCLYLTPQTVQQRRSALVVRMRSVDDLTKQFFIDLAATIGYTITVDENVDGSPFKWRVNSSGATITDFTVGSSTVGDALRSWGDALLECTIARYTPAHTQVLFAYLVVQPASIPSAEAFGTPTIA